MKSRGQSGVVFAETLDNSGSCLGNNPDCLKKQEGNKNNEYEQYQVSGQLTIPCFGILLDGSRGFGFLTG